jgi:hypothetical protein
LIGVRLADFTTKKESQLTLFDTEESTETVENEDFKKTIDNINSKFGKSIVAPASLKMISNRSKEKEKLQK